MTGITITVDSAEVERVNKLLAGIPGGTQKALYNAIDRAQATVRSKTTKAISGVYAITQQNIRAATNIKSRISTSGGGIVGEVTFAGNKIPLYRYGVSPKVPTRTMRDIQINMSGSWKTVRASAPVSAVIKRGGARKTSGSAFIARMQSGHIGVFERVGANSYPITERMGLATAQMAENSLVLEDVEHEAQETFIKRAEQEILRLMNGWG